MSGGVNVAPASVATGPARLPAMLVSTFSSKAETRLGAARPLEAGVWLNRLCLRDREAGRLE